MFLSFQEPLEVPGLSVSNFIRNALQQKKGGYVRLWDFKKEMKAAMEPEPVEAQPMEPAPAEPRPVEPLCDWTIEVRGATRSQMEEVAKVLRSRGITGLIQKVKEV